MPQISVIDRMTLDEELVLSFYKECPGADWVLAAEALHMEEEKVFNISSRLCTIWGKLEMHWNLFALSTFTVKRNLICDQQNQGKQYQPDGAETLATRHFELTPIMPS